ncbi:MAG TPA: GNAT family N-acetyltransferase [Candidatus Dormibacteraeota bacterium]
MRRWRWCRRRARLPADSSEPSAAKSEGIEIREVAVDVVLPLRHAILRAGRPLESAHARQDDAPGTRHLAAYAGPRVVGVVSQFPEDTALAPSSPADRFRGMAVDPAWRGHGVGRALMRAVADLAKTRGAEILWANGRDTALGFYTSIGFRVAGDGFVDGEMHLGHHVVIAGIDELRI